MRTDISALSPDAGRTARTAPHIPSIEGKLPYLRWVLAGVVALTNLVGYITSETAEGMGRYVGLAFNLAGGLLGVTVIWASLSWVHRQQQRHTRQMVHALGEQQELNHRLQRANQHLSLLGEVKRRIAGARTEDDILDSTLAFCERLVPLRVAAVVLRSPTGPVDIRVVCGSREELENLRAAHGAFVRNAMSVGATETTSPSTVHRDGKISTAIVLPLDDSVAIIGWMEIYLREGATLRSDEVTLLEAIAIETTDALVGARRRAREERDLYELERAISEERARIARDIHDGIAQTLAFQHLRVDLWQDWIASDPARLSADLGELKWALRDQIRELRRAIFALRPMQFGTLGFAGGLRRYIGDFASQQGWRAEIDLDEVLDDLPPAVEVTCFRIIQEGLTNVAKHADATTVTVIMERTEAGMSITVRDNGQGFDSDGAHADATHVGLQQMAERLATLRGQFVLRSHPGAGTEIRASIPLNPHEQESRQ